MERTSIFAAVFVGITVTMVLGYWMIPWLKKIKYGQTINDIGPTWHKYKEGTPTMGGLMFIIGTFCAIVVGYISLVHVFSQTAGCLFLLLMVSLDV